MKVENWNIIKVKPYDKNPRNNDGAVESTANSIKEFGWQQPIVVDKDGVIIVGHTRLKAAKQLNLKQVPVTVAENLTDEQVKAYRLADNKTSELAEWDVDMLDDELNDILNIDMEDFGFDIVGQNDDEVVDDDFDEEPPEEPTSKLGDVYQLGRHRLMCGDSTDREQVRELVGKNKVDYIYTDPPYGMNAVSHSGVMTKTYGKDILNDDNNQVAVRSIENALLMFPSAHQLWWGANYYCEATPSAECWIIWDKKNGQSDQADCELAWTNFRSVPRMISMASDKTGRVHPNQKPIKLFTEILERISNFNSSVVLDLFGGSGSTLMACEQTSRDALLMEYDPRYVDVIIKRWEEFTGKKAVKISK